MFEGKAIHFGRKQSELLGKAKAGKQAENNLILDNLVYGQALSQENFVYLYEIYFPRLYSYIACRTTDRQEAEDIVAFVFEQLLSKFQMYDPQRGSLDNWIFTIARNALTDRQRYKRRHNNQTLDEHLEIEADVSLSEQFLRQEEIQQLHRYLGRLSERERELLILRYSAGLPHRRIGEIMKMTEGSVAVTLGRILRKLYRYFEADEAVGQ